MNGRMFTNLGDRAEPSEQYVSKNMTLTSVQELPGRRSFSGASRRVPELDGLRGVAILLVIVSHYFIDTVVARRGTALFYVLQTGRLAWSGVDLFFVLSGFLIGGILLDVRKSARYFQVFYSRRFCRIVPIYMAMCVVWWIATQSTSIRPSVTLAEVFPHPSSWWPYVTYTQNFWMAYAGGMGVGWATITWSLAVEEQFYLTMPAVIRYVNERGLPILLGLGILLAVFLRVLLFRVLPRAQGAAATFALMPCRADSLLLGVLAAWLVRRQSVWAYLSTHSHVLLRAFIVLAGGFVYLTVRAPLRSGWPIASVGYTWLALLYLCILLTAVAQTESILARALRSRVLAWFGLVSYGSYLIHTAVLGLTFGFLRHHSPRITGLGDLLVTMFAVVLTFVIAQISWSFFEGPIVTCGRSLEY